MSQAITRVATIRGSSPLHPADRIGAAILPALLHIVREWRIRRDLRHVASLDDRILADIGIGRSQIENAVRCGRQRSPGAAGPAVAPSSERLGWTERR